MLAMELLRRLGCDVMSVLIHARGGAAKATWSWHDVAAESC
jgi:hypothetical protein